MPPTNDAPRTSSRPPASPCCPRPPGCAPCPRRAECPICRRSPRSAARPRGCTSSWATSRDACSRRCTCAARRPDRRAARVDEEGLTTVFRSRHRRACDERALVLTAVGLPAEVALGDGEFLLRVPSGEAAYAVQHLLQYEAENRPPPPPPPPPRPWPYAWLGCVAYVLVLMLVTAALSRGLVRLDAFDLGELDAARVQAGEYWRAWTALTLHVDGPHLAANLLAGVWFGYLAGRQMGPGTAWLLTVTGAALANLLEGLLGPAEHVSVGASTAVFAALGAMSAYSWRERLGQRLQWG